MYNLKPQTNEEQELWFRSEKNRRQFLALSHRLTNTDIENEILNNAYFLKVTKAANISNIEVSQWLKNSWNTESILAQNLTIIENTKQSFCMQWAFPQAYYSVFGNILAMFKSIGYTETSHTAVLKKYGVLMSEAKLPETISISCHGIENAFTYNHIVFPAHIQGAMVELDLTNADNINHHICQFLRATRKLRLQEKAPTMNFKTQTGAKRKNLTQAHWHQVSNSIGNTTILDFLYRKRIKGNYQDIETYNCPYFKGEEVLDCLIKIVSRLNLVSEIYIAKVIGLESFESLVDYQLSKVANPNLAERFDICKIVIEASA